MTIDELFEKFEDNVIFLDSGEEIWREIKESFEQQKWTVDLLLVRVKELEDRLNIVEKDNAWSQMKKTVV